MVQKSIMRVWFLNVIVGLVALLGQQVLEVLGRKRDYLLTIARVLLNHCLAVVLEDVGELVRYYDLFGAVYALFADVGH